MSRLGEMLHWTSSTDPALERLLDELANRLEEGEEIDLDELAVQYPEQAEELRRVVPAMEALIKFRESVGDGSVSFPARGDGGANPSGTLGDYRILREVGRGGMGVVYEAEQVSLGRRVALKVLPFAATMDPRHLQRFHNEARAAASLHHEHIVPVHGVGCEGGVHFYAMQLIDGVGLDRLIADLRHECGREAPPSPSPPDALLETPRPGPMTPASTHLTGDGVGYYRRVAELGVQAAEALDHAHTMGIVHRDVKPGNLLIDGQGKLWVTDFGLAKLEADPGVTLTGDLVGTLRYMSPEQALAKHGLVDHRSDVYSLGATLYELLTLQPAIKGEDRREVLHRIAHQEPTSPHKLDGRVPGDLETVVLKAMAKVPAERYDTAGELARDLSRHLAGEPIRAKPPGPMSRLRKWAERHQSVVLAGGLGLCLTLIVTSAASVVIWREKQQAHRLLADLELQQGRTERQRQRAEDNFGMVLNGMTELLAEVESLDSLEEEQRQELRERFADHMEEFFQRVRQGSGDDSLGRLQTGWAYQHLGTMYLRFGDYGRAGKYFRKGLAIHERLANQQPSNSEVIWMYAQSLDRLADVAYLTGRPGEAKRLHERALAEFRRRLEFDPGWRSHCDVARSMMTVLDPSQRGDPTEAVRLASRAVDLAGERIDAWYILALSRYRAGDYRAAREPLRKVVEADSYSTTFGLFLSAMNHWQLGERDLANRSFDLGVKRLDGRHRGLTPQLRSIRQEAAGLLGKEDPPSPPP